MKAYVAMWDAYYSPEHIARIMRRAAATGMSPGNMMLLTLWFYVNFRIDGVHPVDGGYRRIRSRKDRRSGMPIENPLIFYPKYVGRTLLRFAGILPLAAKVLWAHRKIKWDKNRKNYRDLALTPVNSQETHDLAMFKETRGGMQAVEKMEKQAGIIAGAKKKPPVPAEAAE
jgi:hypothetical protein